MRFPTNAAKLASTSILALALSACATMDNSASIADNPMADEGVTEEGVAEEGTEASAITMEPAPLAELIAEVDIPYEQFTLDNGLTVLVHTDRKAPVVAISVWYGVGSKHEPEGKTGFAHLFEHLMFNGSENAEGDFFEPLQQIGATDFNGTTWFDRTNYLETVPTGALDRALMLESDRMGYLLGAVTQEKLDSQIGVVQNEKRQRDNNPYGLVAYEQLENLYPSGHPYHHSTIGSMDDLSSATLDDVKQWFRDYYGPNNAIIVLAGDIDTVTARDRVQHWFGAIEPGPEIPAVSAPVPDLDSDKSKTIYDRVSTTRIYRMWAIPGLDNTDYLPLSLGATVLGGLASSRLDNELVRGQELAVRVGASAHIFAQAGQFVVSADVKPGVDPEAVAAALDEEIAKFIAEGPTQDELQRAATGYTAGQIRGLEQVGGFEGKAPTLAAGLLYSGNPDEYKRTLNQAATISPEEVRSITARWLSRPVFSLRVEPGDRQEGGEDRGGFVVTPEGSDGLSAPAFFISQNGDGRSSAGQTSGSTSGTSSGPSSGAVEADRSSLPEVGELKPLDFPDVERATLDNGMEVYFARRADVPVVYSRLSFDVGFTADDRSRLGVQSMMLQLMDEGTANLDSTQLAIAKERLGVQLGGGADVDETFFTLNTLSPNMAPSFQLLAEYVRMPAFGASDLERVRAQQLTSIQNELTSTRGIAYQVLWPILFGEHPYGIPLFGLGNTETVESISRDEIIQFHSKWLRPDNAKIFIVGDTSLAEVTSQLNASFGDWATPSIAAPSKDFDVAIPAQQSRIILLDRPDSPQSVIIAGRVLEQKGIDDQVTLRAANEVLGGSFLSRINMNLREDKGWSYGGGTSIYQKRDRSTLLLYVPVQADRTGDSITEIRSDLAAFLGDEGVSDEELTRLINRNVRELPGRFETSGAVMDGLVGNVFFDRPSDYYETLPGRYSGLTTQELDASARSNLIGDDLVWVVVGDASIVREQLDDLGLPIEVLSVEEQARLLTSM